VREKEGGSELVGMNFIIAIIIRRPHEEAFNIKREASAAGVSSRAIWHVVLT
jgi:hypothetical protein